jgi:methionyl-tRNA synthetase
MLSADDRSVEEAFTTFVELYKFNDAMNLIWEHIQKGDEYMTEREPYKKVKDAATKGEALADIEKLVRHVVKVAVHLQSCMPHTSELILNAVKENKKPVNLFPRLLA